MRQRPLRELLEDDEEEEEDEAAAVAVEEEGREAVAEEGGRKAKALISSRSLWQWWPQRRLAMRCIDWDRSTV